MLRACSRLVTNRSSDLNLKARPSGSRHVRETANPAHALDALGMMGLHFGDLTN
jgi:hypothetical protein